MAGKLGDHVTKIKEFVLVPLLKYKSNTESGGRGKNYVEEKSPGKKQDIDNLSHLQADQSESTSTSRAKNSPEKVEVFDDNGAEQKGSPAGKVEQTMPESKRKRRAGRHLKKGGRNCVQCGLNCEMFPVKISNFLAATKLGCRIDLGKLAAEFPNTVYNPRKMKCVVWNHRKIGGKQVVALVFGSGYLSVNGSKTVYDAKKYVRKYARAIQKRGYQISYVSTSIQAISAVASLPAEIKPNLDFLANKLGGMYEPELFTAACLKFHRMSFLVFASGKIVITGIRNSNTSRKNVLRFLSKIFHICIGIC